MAVESAIKAFSQTHHKDSYPLQIQYRFAICAALAFSIIAPASPMRSSHGVCNQTADRQSAKIAFSNVTRFGAALRGDAETDLPDQARLQQDASTLSSLVDRVGQTGFLQLYAPSFEHLPLREKVLAYWLSMAAIAINPIVYDQNSVHGLEEKRLLDEILTHSKDIDPQVLQKIIAYTKLFWANRGNHNSFTSKKFVPNFTFNELKFAARQALQDGARLGSRAQLDQELEQLRESMFDPNYRSMLTVKNPTHGEDPLAISSNNLYQDVRLSDLGGFHQKYPLNSRLVKRGGKLVEEVYRAGTPDGRIPPGLYARQLRRAIAYFEEALPYASAAQARILQDIIRYYETGSAKDWRRFNIDWVQNESPVDFTNGFIEVYKDPLGMKGSSQAFVTVVDGKMNKLMLALASNAGHFERSAPWEAKYKRVKPSPPIAEAVEALIETGDFDVDTIGENLPNEAEIHRRYGSKSFIFTGTMRAFSDATGGKVTDEFTYSPGELERAMKYGQTAANLFTAMHEIIGHGSGKMDPRLTHEPAYYLKEYYSTLEEARADLVALWNFFDPRLIQMGVMPNFDVAKAAYDAEARSALVQLREVRTGNTIEEDHRRATQLIVNFIRDKTDAIEPVQHDGKVYLVVENYKQMREGVGVLLAKLMRIKAEGDYEGAKALITQYGIHFNTAWRDQVVERYKKLNLPIYWAGINPDLNPVSGPHGKVLDVTITYPRDFVAQQIRYSKIAGE